MSKAARLQAVAGGGRVGPDDVLIVVSLTARFLPGELWAQRVAWLLGAPLSLLFPVDMLRSLGVVTLALAEIVVPAGGVVVGKTLRQINLRADTGTTMAALVRGGSTSGAPLPRLRPTCRIPSGA